MDQTGKPQWGELLRVAVEEPGFIHAAYSRMYTYSLGNQMLALWQCQLRGIKPGPIATYGGWIKAGRYVRKGEKAISLTMPIVVKRRRQSEDEDADGDGDDTSTGDGSMRIFVLKPHWFALSQTDGQHFEIADPPEWESARALAALGIERVEFAHADGNCMGYASGRRIAVSPLAYNPLKTLLHEAAHVLMHTGDHNDPDSPSAPDLREVEAETTAYLVLAAIAPDSDMAPLRGYIQKWLGHAGYTSIPDGTARRILSSADKLLKAGRPVQEQTMEVAKAA